MWGIVPAAGRGSRIKPLAFSKEWLPVGSRVQGQEERARRADAMSFSGCVERVDVGTLHGYREAIHLLGPR